MRIASLSVKNYRSIIQAQRLAFSNRTVLLGPNNEGKSNLLRALQLAYTTISAAASLDTPAVRNRRYSSASQPSYSFEDDIPQSLRDTKGQPQTEIVLELELSNADRRLLRNATGHSFNKSLPIEIVFNPRLSKLRIIKQGPGSKAINENISTICRYVRQNVVLAYIPAFRNAETAEDTLSDLIRALFRDLEASPEYQAALRRIDELQSPVLDSLSKALKNTLSEFIDDVVAVSVEIPDQRRRQALRATSVQVDDGCLTSLSSKGDGLQSLAALAVARYVTMHNAKQRSVTLAVEEPESHLHPEAIYRLKSVLMQISDKQQIILSTHNPLLADRTSIGNNIVVSQGEARPAKTVSDIRNALGVRLSDSLGYGEVTVLVEGETDRQVLQAYIAYWWPDVWASFDTGAAACFPLTGGQNLRYRATDLATSLAKIHILIDHETAMINEASLLIGDGIVDNTDINYMTFPGKKQSELEDLYDAIWMRGIVGDCLNIQFDKSDWSGTAKWSVRLLDAAKQHGRVLSKSDVLKIKIALSNAAAQEVEEAISPHGQKILDSVAQSVDEKLHG